MIKTYKDYFLERNEEDSVIENYLQPVGKGEHSDCTCFQLAKYTPRSFESQVFPSVTESTGGK